MLRMIGLMLLTSGSVAAATQRITLHNGDVLTMDCQRISSSQQRCQHPVLGTVLLDDQQVQSTKSIDAPSPATAAMPAPASPWHVQLDVSANARRGIKHSNTLTLHSDLKYQTDQWRYSLDTRFDLEDKDSTRKTHKYQLTPAVDWFFTPSWFWRNEIEYQYDFLASDYQNWDLSSGPGWRWWHQDNDNYAETMVSVGLKQAWFRDEDPLYRGLFGDDPVLSYQFIALDWDLQRELFSQVSVYSKGRWLQLTNQPQSIIDFDYEASNELGVRYQLSDAIRLSWSWYYQRTQLRIVLPNIPEYSIGLNDSRQQLAIGVDY